jgi:hypothetical protein
MAVPIPDFSVWGVSSYLLFAVGLAASMELFAPPMMQVQNLIGNLRNGA